MPRQRRLSHQQHMHLRCTIFGPELWRFFSPPFSSFSLLRFPYPLIFIVCGDITEITELPTTIRGNLHTFTRKDIPTCGVNDFGILPFRDLFSLFTLSSLSSSSASIPFFNPTFYQIQGPVYSVVGTGQLMVASTCHADGGDTAFLSEMYQREEQGRIEDRVVGGTRKLVEYSISLIMHKVHYAGRLLRQFHPNAVCGQRSA